MAALPPPYPLFLDLVQRPVLIVGGGSVALRKARGLVECAARVTVVSPEFLPAFEALADLEKINAPYAATHMARKMWRLVFATTNVREVNDQVVKHANAAGIFCCRSDDPEAGDFSGAATERLGADQQVTVAVSTNGASPVLSSRICKEAARAIDPVLAIWVKLLTGWRGRVKIEVDIRARRGLLQRIAGEEMEQVLREDGEAAAEALFRQWIEETRVKNGVATSAPQTPARQRRLPDTVKHAD